MENFRPESKVTKMVALVFIIIAALIILPMIASLVVNLITGAIALVVMLFIGYNYQLVWSIFDNLSWKLTKKYVSANKVEVIRQYIQIQHKKLSDIKDACTSVGGVRIELTREIASLEETISKDVRTVKNSNLSADSQNRVATKISIDTDTINRLKPELAKVVEDEKTLIDIYTLLNENIVETEYRLTSHIREYELKKKIATASGKVDEFIKGRSADAKMYNESLRQMEESVGLFTAQIQQFRVDYNSDLELGQAKKSIEALKGLSIVENYGKNHS